MIADILDSTYPPPTPRGGFKGEKESGGRGTSDQSQIISLCSLATATAWVAGFCVLGQHSPDTLFDPLMYHFFSQSHCSFLGLEDGAEMEAAGTVQTIKGLIGAWGVSSTLV